MLDLATRRSSSTTGTSDHHHHHHHQQTKDHNHRLRQRPRSSDFDHSHDSLDIFNNSGSDRLNHLHGDIDCDRDDTEDNLADEEFEDDEVGRDVRKRNLKALEHHHSAKNWDDYNTDSGGGNLGAAVPAKNSNGVSCRGISSSGGLREVNVINDELKYGAGHQHNHHPSIDSNPVESQSEWSDDDCREEATGGVIFMF